MSEQHDYCRHDVELTAKVWARLEALPKPSLLWHLTHWGRWSWVAGRIVYWK